MKVVYLDLHIHTSENPNKLNLGYDVSELVNHITLFTDNSVMLISLTDHNSINKDAYQKLDSISKTNQNVKYLIGAELSILNFKSAPFYHCHFYFKSTIADIDDLNKILDELYPTKTPSDGDDIPSLEYLVKRFNDYEFLVIPHGGQSHRSFDSSIPSDVIFDSLLEKNLYYNTFDGFSSRSNKKTEKTRAYFKRLGIDEVVNLVTGSDNYVIDKYPEDKNASENFIPTWMFADPNYNGLRIALSDSQRLTYEENKPETWAEYIRGVSLSNEKVKIDVNLTPGLNVIIGGSSSGKSLFAEAIYNKIKNKDQFPEDVNEKYGLYGIDRVVIDNPSAVCPHYISQNYIANVIGNSNKPSGIESIDIIKNVFKLNEETQKEIDQSETKVRTLVATLVSSVENIHKCADNLRKIPDFSRLIIKENISNPLDAFLPNDDLSSKMKFDKLEYSSYTKTLKELLEFSNRNLFFEDISGEITSIMEKMLKAYLISDYERRVRSTITSFRTKYSQDYLESSLEKATKISQTEQLGSYIKEYVTYKKNFSQSFQELKAYDFRCESEEKESNGHTLIISNELKVNNAILLVGFNEALKTQHQLKTLDGFSEFTFEKSKFSGQRPVIRTYDDLKNHLINFIFRNNKVKYDIITKDKKEWAKLSPGWKTAIILDIILGYKNDFAPIIIDQPEDNLASEYINDALINSIKTAKKRKQILIITHSASIPLLGDAQNIVLCEINKENDNITISSGTLEGEIKGVDSVDHIVRIADGGKIAVKKRIKKYNLKRIFMEDKDGTKGNQS